MNEYWRNDYCRLFEIEDGHPVYLRASMGVWRIIDTIGERARVIFYGRLPYDNGGPWITEGAQFEIVQFNPGDVPDHYKVGEVLVRIKDCKLRRRWAGIPVSIHPDQTDYVKGYAEVECDIEWIGEGDKND